MRWIFALFLLVMLGCEDAKDYSKDYKTRRVVDSLFRKEIKEIKPKLNAQCSIRTTQLVDGMVDSILVLRRKEIEDILRREALEHAKE